MVLENLGSLFRNLGHLNITAKWISISGHLPEEKLLKATLCGSENQKQSVQNPEIFHNSGLREKYQTSY